MAARMSLIVKAEGATEAVEFMRERMIPLHFNENVEVRRANGQDKWVVEATCAIDYDPTHLLNEWYAEDLHYLHYLRHRTYPMGSLLSWSKREDGGLITMEFSRSELVGLFYLLHDHGMESNPDLYKRVERTLRDEDIKHARA